MARAKFSLSKWRVPCILTTIVAAMFLISSNFGPNFESLTLKDFKYPHPKYTPMVDNLTDAALLHDAALAVERPMRPNQTPRIAFLFIVRDNIPQEPLWRRFFHNHDDKYSLYVHPTPGHLYPNTSLFFGREVPSYPSPRFSRGIVDAFRRLLSHALLDPRAHNAWFVNVCESAIPIRSFAFTYHYLTTSAVSFVESFYPIEIYQHWETLPAFNKTELRKGELWMALRRDHAGVVIRDTEIYSAFLAKCSQELCTWDEQYVQTLLHLKDEYGIARRTVMYVNWTGPHGGSPQVLASRVSVVQELQERKWDVDGERHDTSAAKETFPCEHKGVVPAPCFLFARKFAAGATDELMAFSALELGY